MADYTTSNDQKIKVVSERSIPHYTDSCNLQESKSGTAVFSKPADQNLIQMVKYLNFIPYV